MSRARPTTRAISDDFRVQNLMPASSSPSPRISMRVRASLSTWMRFAESAAGMSRSSSWLPRIAKTP